MPEAAARSSLGMIALARLRDRTNARIKELEARRHNCIRNAARVGSLQRQRFWRKQLAQCEKDILRVQKYFIDRAGW